MDNSHQTIVAAILNILANLDYVEQLNILSKCNTIVYKEFDNKLTQKLGSEELNWKRIL